MGRTGSGNLLIYTVVLYQTYIYQLYIKLVIFQLVSITGMSVLFSLLEVGMVTVTMPPELVAHLPLTINSSVPFGDEKRLLCNSEFQKIEKLVKNTSEYRVSHK